MRRTAWIHVISANARQRRVAEFSRNGIAVVRSLDQRGRWTLAHQPTGRRMPYIGSRLRLEQAIGIASMLADAGDWRGLASETRDQAVIDEVLGVCKATAEMFGVEW